MNFITGDTLRAVEKERQEALDADKKLNDYFSDTEYPPLTSRQIMAAEQIMDIAKEMQKDRTIEISSNKGIKNDTGKPSITLIPKEALWGMAQAFTYGSVKYGRHNFREGIDYSRLADAAYRHLSAYMDGETIDKESGNNHLYHALASIAMLTYMDANKPEHDDRYKGNK